MTEEKKEKCPWCGRVKAVQQLEEHLFNCTYCSRMFDDRDDD